MASNPVAKSKAPAAREPNILERFGDGLHKLLVGTKPAPAARKPGKPPGGVQTTGQPNKTSKTQKSQTPHQPASTKNAADKSAPTANNPVGAPTGKKQEICWAPLTMKSADGASRYCISKNQKGAGYVARDPKGNTVTLPINKLTESHAALKPTSDRAVHADRVKREGTALQKQSWSDAARSMPAKTEFKQGGPDQLAGLGDSARQNVNMAIHVGKKMAHSKLIVVAQIGEGIGLVTDLGKGLNAAAHAAPKFFSDTGDLISGRTKTSKRELLAGSVSGAGKFAYGMGAGLIDLGARVVMPGDWRDNVSSGLGAGQQALDNSYRGAVKKLAKVDPDSKGYNVASNATQIVGTVASLLLPVKAAKGGGVTKATKVANTETKVGNAVRNNAVKPPMHPVEGLGKAVKDFGEGKINKVELNEAMAKANEAFKAQKGPDTPSWTKEMRKNYIDHSGDANGALSGANRGPKPSSPTSPANPSTPTPTPVGQTPSAKGSGTKSDGTKSSGAKSSNANASNNAASSQLPSGTSHASAAPATSELSATLHTVKTPEGKWRLEHAHGQAPNLKAVVQAVADGTLTKSQLKKANFSEAAIQGIANDAKALKNATKQGQKSAQISTNASPAAEPARASANPSGQGGTRIDSPQIPDSTARRPGESMHDYLARHEVEQSLNAAQQASADNTGMRMSMSPPKNSSPAGRAAGEPQPQPQPQRQPTSQTASNQGPQYAEPLDLKPLDLKPQTSGEIVRGNQPSAPAARTTSTASAPATPRGISETPNPSQANGGTRASQTTGTDRPATPQTNGSASASPGGIPPGGVPPSRVGGAGASGDRPAEPPRLLTPLEKSSGALAQPFGQNVNPSLRQIVDSVQDGSVAMDRYSADTPRRVVEANINESLSRSGINVGNHPSAAKHIITVAEGLDVNPAQLANQLIRTTRDATQQVERYTPQNPLLVDGSKAGTLSEGTRYFTSLFSQGVQVPAQSVPITVDGKTYDLSKNAGLHTTAMNSDIDGPFAASYGQQGLDVTTRSLNGQPIRFHVQLPAKLEGTPLRLYSPPGLDSPSAMLDVEVQTGNRRGVQTINIPVTVEQQQLIRRGDSTTSNLNYVESLSARVFPPESVEFWKGVSQQNGPGGGAYPGNVQSPSVVFNTFGSMGQRAYDNSAELVTSLARSLRPGSVPANVEPGLFAAKNVTVYSGGSAVTKNGVSEPFGLSAAQESAMKQVATQMPELVTRYARAYDLSKGATDAWQSSIFANPDIPSIIIPGRTLSEFSNRTSATHPGKTFADLQRQIESDLTSMVNQDRGDGFKMSEFVQLHHTPSNPGDTVAVMEPAVNGKQKDFTTEWQFAVKGQKAVPVLDSVANDLRKNYNIDLKAELESAGYSYGEIRKQELEQTVEFLSGFARSRIEASGAGQQITPRVIVPVDTYYEAGGIVAGSDASLTRSAAGLYSPSRTHIVQVDTGGGKPTEGRQPQFRFGTDANGQITLDREGLSKPAVDGNGPNGELAPTVFVRSAADMGEMFNRAYREQSPLSRQEVDQMRRR